MTALSGYDCLRRGRRCRNGQQDMPDHFLGRAMMRRGRAGLGRAELTADDPFDPANLEKVEGVVGIASVGPHMTGSILVAPGGQTYVAPFHWHDKVVMDAMRIGGYVDGPDDDEYLADYPSRSGVLYVQLFFGTLTASGVPAMTDSQKKSLKDICTYAHITDPGKIAVFVDNASPRELCAGVDA